MRVCDKCKKRKVEKIIKAEGKEIELCSQCYHHILEWIDKPEEKGILGGFFRGQ